MILQEGDKILVAHRRLFENDKSRYFVGVVDGYESGIIKVSGYTWTKEQFGGNFVKKSDRRTKILSISSGTLMIYELPQILDLNTLQLKHVKDGQDFLMDNSNFRMDLAEIDYKNSDKR